MYKPITYFICFIFFFVSCQTDMEYETSIENWHQLRIDSLKGETGFLNLAGLFWLEEGVNTFGSDSSNDFNFTSVSSPILGNLILRESLVYLVPNNKIKIESKLVEDTTLVFGKDGTKNMRHKSLSWNIIERGGNIGVRLRDFNHPLINEFNSIDYFETDPIWKVEAQWKAYKEPKIVSFSNVIGMSIDYPVYGSFDFKIEGEKYSLEPMGEAYENEYFVMFYDNTSGDSTYGSGRYIYVDEPDSMGHTIIDFNKAYNPPCAFTEFATCLFPHKQNRLPIFINAGEKYSVH